MTYLELQNIVSRIVDDDDFDGDIGDYLNQGVSEIANGMQSSLGSFITPPLPALFKIDTVDTESDEAYVSMPTTFQRGLTFVADSSGIEIEIANSMINFSQRYPLLNRIGKITETIEQGGNLYYQGIPATSEELTLHFYRYPVEMVEDSDTPDGIPLSLQRSLLVNYACWRCFELIEDGVEGQGLNTVRYNQRFSIAMRTLELFIPFDTNSIYMGEGND